MPMGIVSPEDYEKEQVRLRPQSNKPLAKTEDINKGRGNTPEVPDVVRETIAKCAINGEGTASEIARAFDVSPSSVSAYKVGSHSTTSYNSPDSNLLDIVTSHKAKISKKARARLISALNFITDEKLENTKALDLSSIAKNMSAVIADMDPPPAQINQNQQNNVQFVFMAPRVRNETEYATIEVND